MNEQECQFSPLSPPLSPSRKHKLLCLLDVDVCSRDARQLMAWQWCIHVSHIFQFIFAATININGVCIFRWKYNNNNNNGIVGLCFEVLWVAPHSPLTHFAAAVAALPRVNCVRN